MSDRPCWCNNEQTTGGHYHYRPTTGVIQEKPMSDHIEAPWTPLQVATLNMTQALPNFHPYTCGRRGETPHRDRFGDTGVLIATRDGWACLDCDYTQKWAHGFTADPDWVSAALRVVEP